MVLSASAACFVLTCVYSMGPFPRVMWTEPSKLSGAENGARGRAWEEQGIRDCQAALWGNCCWACICTQHCRLSKDLDGIEQVCGTGGEPEAQQAR